MEIHHLSALDPAGARYLEFLRTQHLSAGIYALPAGATDTQSPHNQEEVYFVLSGIARFTNTVRDEPVHPGDLIFVNAREPHKFHEIVEDLKLLVLFAPPESSR